MLYKNQTALQKSHILTRVTFGNVLGDQDVSHKNGVKWSVTKKRGFAARLPAPVHPVCPPAAAFLLRF